MSYRPTAAGHAVRESPRDITQETIDEKLVDLAKGFLDEKEPRYDVAFKMTEHVITTARAAGLLALHPVLQKHKNHRLLGTFISALWNNHALEDAIVYPHDTPDISNIGVELPAKKLLILQGRTGGYAGVAAKGPVIITGTAGDFAGNSSDGPVIIRGKTGLYTGALAKGLLIEITPANISAFFIGTFITPEQYKKIKPLKEYVERLLDHAKENPEAITHEFGDGVKIAAKINKLIGGAK